MAIDTDDVTYVSPFKRGIATGIDVFVVLFLRIFAMQILGVLWLNRELTRLVEDFKEYYGSDVISDPAQMQFIFNHPVFKEILLFMVIIFLVGTVYHAYLNSSNWRATVGKRVMGFIILNRTGERMNFLRGVGHYFLSIVPMVIILYLLLFQTRHDLGFVQAVTANSTNIFLAFIAVTWINVHIFTNRKVTAYDLLCKTVLVEGKTNYKFPWSQ